MELQEYYSLLIADLKVAGLSQQQIREALLPNVSSEEDKQAINKMITIKASWLPDGMTPIPGTSYNSDASSAYLAKLEEINGGEARDEERGAADETRQKEREELVKTVQATATLADKKGYYKQASLLDELLEKLTLE